MYERAENEASYTKSGIFVYGRAERMGSYTKSGNSVYGRAENEASYTKSGIFVYGRGKGRLALQPGEEIVYAGAGDGEIRELGIAAAEGDL